MYLFARKRIGSCSALIGLLHMLVPFITYFPAASISSQNTSLHRLHPFRVPLAPPLEGEQFLLLLCTFLAEDFFLMPYSKDQVIHSFTLYSLVVLRGSFHLVSKFGSNFRGEFVSKSTFLRSFYWVILP